VRFTRTMTGAALIAALACAACGGGAARATDTANTSASGNYVKVTLHHGAFELNVAKLIAAEGGSAPALDPATCSGVSLVTAPASVVDGKGTYQGITGTVDVTETIAFILPRYTSGRHIKQCDNNTQPIDAYSPITGSGKIKF
jgi:hypothetical protein